nr:RecName: Full=Short cationic peptide-6c; Short=SCP-6c; AltName: Full=Short cationic peptide-6i; Short=SCP-6i; AltName: Full=Truncated variant of Cupiennin 6 family [Cupiennius salei]
FLNPFRWVINKYR